MSNKKTIVIPPVFGLGNALGIRNRKIKAAVFVPNRNYYPNLFLLESSLFRLNFLDIIGWFTNEKGLQRGRHRLRKSHDLCSSGEIDMAICYSKEDIVSL